MRARRRVTRALVAMALAMSVIPMMGLPAVAASAPEVVATGLNGPWKLTEGPDGAIYVAEAGTGGDVCTMVPSPDGEEVEACAGETGSVTRIGTTTSRVATGFPSVVAFGEVGGLSAVDFDSSGQMFVLLGLGGASETRTALGQELFGTLLRVPATGDPVLVADLVAFEEENDPDAEFPGVEGPDTNPFGLAFDGLDALVADAGANAVLRIEPDGTTTVEAAFPPTFVDPPPFIPIPGQIPMQAVPTSVEVDADGEIHVSQLTGFPFVVGAANIWTISGGTATPEHTGFTNVIDHAIADDGTMYVLEFASNGLLSEAPAPALVEVRTDGTRKTLLYGDELPVPGGVAVGSDGMVYLSVCALCGPGQGMVWAIDPSVASDSATAAACDPADVPGSGFEDTAPSQHREAIDCAAWWGVVNGFSATAFVPDGNITRGQVASMIARALRAAGVVFAPVLPDAFPDDDGSVHEADINALANAEVILGLPDGNFNPSGDVTRAQVASMVARAYLVAAGSDLAAGTDAFTDDDGSVHEDDINAVALAGWVNGIGGGLFNPDGNTTRAQFSSIITRMLSTLVDEGSATLPA